MTECDNWLHIICSFLDLFGARPFGVASPVTSPTVEGGRTPVVSDVFGMEMFNPSTAYPSFDLDEGTDKEQLDLEVFHLGMKYSECAIL